MKFLGKLATALSFSRLLTTTQINSGAPSAAISGIPKLPDPDFFGLTTLCR